MAAYDEIVHLSSLAAAALAEAGGSDVNLFAERVENYLAAVDQWQQANPEGALREAVMQLPEDRRAVVRSELEALSRVHQQVLDATAQHRDAVAHRIGQVQVRTKQIRKYVDTLPSRITIAGKRQG